MYFEYTWVVTELKKQGWKICFPEYYWEVLTAVKGGRKIALPAVCEDNSSLHLLRKKC